MRSATAFAGLVATAAASAVVPRASSSMPVPASSSSFAYGVPTSMSPECSSSVQSLGKSIPTPADDLLSYLQTAVTMVSATETSAVASEVCGVFTNMPTSVASAWVSYTTAASSWYDAHSSDLDALTTCVGKDMLRPMPGMGHMPTPSACSGGPFPNGVVAASSTSSPDGSNGSDGSSSPSASGSSVPTGAAARPTGVMAGAAAAAGFIGVVALL